MTEPASPPAEAELGRGRSAVVYRAPAPGGGEMARKVFVGEPVADAIQTLLTGAPNPYGWDPATAEAGYRRRRILEPLLAWWFGGRARLPATCGWGFNPGHRAFEIRTELIDGRPAALDHPMRHEPAQEARQLHRAIMQPLQRHLREAGFDGLVWQAGLGNPVAGSNFLHETRDGGRWVWIDAESGLPALFPLDPRPLLTFYLPRSLYYRAPLFDHTDTDRLESYLAAHAAALDADLGPGTSDFLAAEAARLAVCERRRRIGGRAARAVRWGRRRGRLTAGQARRLRRRPLRCALWMGRQSVRRAAVAGWAGLCRLARGFRWRRVAAAFVHCARLVVGPTYRERLARRIALARVRAWRRRGQMGPEASRELRRLVRRDESSVYLGDFGAHVGIKPAVKIVQYWVLPPLFVAGVIGALPLVLGIAMGGAIGRTLYTAIRCVTAMARAKPPPLLALGVGALPVVGNAAFPLQLLWSTGPSGRAVGRFMVIDLVTGVGTALPIWGGRDTLTEHAANRMGRRIVRAVSRMRGGHR